MLADFACAFDGITEKDVNVIALLKNKVNEVVIEYNHLAKDLELHKEALKTLSNRLDSLRTSTT